VRQLFLFLLLLSGTCLAKTPEEVFEGRVPSLESIAPFKMKIIENISLLPREERISRLGACDGDVMKLKDDDIYLDLTKEKRAFSQEEFASFIKGEKSFTPLNDTLKGYRKSQVEYLLKGVRGSTNEEYTKIFFSGDKKLLSRLYVEGGIRGSLEDRTIIFNIPEAVYLREHFDHIIATLKGDYNEKMPIPFKVLAYETIVYTDKNMRKKALKDAGLNLFLLRSDDVLLDALTDSGNGAMSLDQWAAMIVGDESYAGSRSFEKMKNTITEITGFGYVLPTHQGRAAENVLTRALVGKGQYVISNHLFTTTAAHVADKGGRSVNITAGEGDFQGNIDLKKLEEHLKDKKGDVAFTVLTLTNNAVGGLPVSIENMKEAQRICQEHGVLLFMDGARFLENAELVKEKEGGYQDKSIREIVLEQCGTFDGMLMSSKKDALAPIGGFVAVKDEGLYKKMAPHLVLMEGFLTYGGQSGNNMEALAQGLQECIKEDYLRYRIKEVKYLADKLVELGVPIVKPFGGHAVFVDAAAILPHIARNEFPAQALNNVLYLEAGVRATESGSLSTGRGQTAANEHLRLTIPHRFFTKDHLDYIAYMVWRVMKKDHKIKGLKFTYEPSSLRAFSAKFKLS
jgi:tryptophanase